MFVLSSKSPNFSNSDFTPPSNFHTSLDLFSIARVLNPICKLFSNATNVFGPETTTLYFWASVSIKTVFLITSQYRLSVGKNIIPKSVV